MNSAQKGAEALRLEEHCRAEAVNADAQSLMRRWAQKGGGEF